MSKSKELTELEAAYRAVKVWNEFGAPLGLSVYGWSYFSSASFVNKHKKVVSGHDFDFIENLKTIREHVTGEKFVFPESYYMED